MILTMNWIPKQLLNLYKTPINRSITAFVLEEKGLITEGIAFDPEEKAFYVGSVHKRKIVRKPDHRFK